MKKTLSLCFVVALLVGAGLGLAEEAKSWTGEVLDMDCYNKDGSKGAAHAACAVKCLQKGSPMGLLLADGSVVTVMADEKNKKPFEDMKSWGGKQVEVTGALTEKEGKKSVTVTGATAK